jgi:hypothetical protein
VCNSWECEKSSVLVICVSQALKMIFPFSFIDVVGSGSTLSRRLNEHIERYIRLVLEDPSMLKLWL